jgi:preprotein translocase SecE subunit
MKEVRATTTVVIIAVAIFGLYFFVIDLAIGRGVNWALKYFTH